MMLRTCALLLAAAIIAAGAPRLHIVVVEGQGAINNARTHTGRDPVVEVRDGDNKPVSGATVTFQAPGTGASAVFANNDKTFITQTDAQGRAVARGLRPNSLKGPFQIHVTASLEGEKDSAIINQTNALPAEGKSSKKVWISVLVAGAAAGGAVAATHGKSGSSSPATSNTQSGSITPGSPSFGPPH
jgi:hypothetical protein